MPLHVALTGLSIGLPPKAVCRVFGSKEVTARTYAAIQYIRQTAELEENERPKPRPISLEAVHSLGYRLLGSDLVLTPSLKRYFSAIHAIGSNLIEAADMIDALTPRALPTFGEERAALLSHPDLDVAFLCFAQIFVKATQMRNPNAFQVAERAASEVTGIPPDQLTMPLRVAFTSAREGLPVPSIAAALGPKQVAERCKKAIAFVVAERNRLKPPAEQVAEEEGGAEPVERGKPGEAASEDGE
ncbi:MAG: hypothetical protein M5R36_00925 [Deltaproteobacteria bacterium]|nr:hypothetical protein [Deltaproteobacteria bacterium]